MRTIKTVEIKACGVLTPIADSAGDLLYHALDSSTRSETGACRCLVPREQLETAACLPTREVRKVDRFSLLALAAARRALGAGNITDDQRSTCGVVTGNMLAGWTFTEPQLRALHETGLENVSPYLATAWFPAAPQGQVTIQLGLHGYAKTVTTDRCSGSQAIGLAFERIRNGRSNLLLAGGVEAPVTPLVREALASMPTAESLSEGAAYLLLQAAEGEVGICIGAHWSRALSSGSRWCDWLASRLRLLGELPLLTWLILNPPPGEEIPLELFETIYECRVAETLQILSPGEVWSGCLAASGALAVVTAWEGLSREPRDGAALVISWGHQCCDVLWIQKKQANGRTMS